ncbi:MAG: hypothetical protein Fur0021_31670 [Candidatus Promineifilaceae bacterium]
MALRALDTVLFSQALITGRIIDALTGSAPLSQPALTLSYQTPPGAPVRLYPLPARLSPGGLFVFAGNPQTAFPRLSPGSTLDLRLTASAVGYETQEIEFSLTDIDLALQPVTRTIGGQQIIIHMLDAPVSIQEFLLLPLPLHLSGRVVEADSPDTPIPNARVRVIAPESRGPVFTNADGFYTLPDMPLAQEITVRARRVDFAESTQTVHLDYRQPVNELNFALNNS